MLVYGPLAFIAGLWGTKHPWLFVVPGTWFVGMLVSRFVYGRCCLNVWTSQIRSIRKKGQEERKSLRYVSERAWNCKAIRDDVPDETDINIKLLNHEKVIHPTRRCAG